MAKKKSGSRRHARKRAFQTLYGLNFWQGHSAAMLPDIFERCPSATGGLPEKVEGYAWELVNGVYTNMAQLDEVISRFSQHWKVERIGRIELTILRLALFEMLHKPDIPLKVAINEAVELAKEFGDEHSGNFVNGILDAAAKAVNKGELGIRKEI